MPGNFAEQIGEADLYDLLAHLLAPRPRNDLPLVPKLLFGNASRKLLFAEIYPPKGMSRADAVSPNRSLEDGRSQTGVWERG